MIFLLYQKGTFIDNLIICIKPVSYTHLGKEFDANFHQAVLTEPREGVESGIVIEVLQKGYMYKDKVLRPSMVKVSE